nr:low molecular weight phosphotyrosine protein phosphatase [Bacteroidia bacterium]
MKIKVLFVCLGNICRSPMAEGVFNSHIEKAKLNQWIEADSAGTSGYH